MTFRFGAAAGVAAILSLPNSAATQVLTQRDVSLHMALAIAQTASQECGANTSVAVVDRAGRLRVFLQGDNANPHNIELARRKAYTARTFRQPSSAWAKRTETVNQFVILEIIFRPIQYFRNRILFFSRTPFFLSRQNFFGFDPIFRPRNSIF